MLLVCELHLVQAAGLGASQELRERAGSSGKIQRAAPGAIDGMPEAVRSVPGVQRFRREPRRIRLWLVGELHLTQANLISGSQISTLDHSTDADARQIHPWCL